MQKVREVCAQYLQVEQLLLIAEQELAKRKEEAGKAAELTSLKAKLDALTAHLDRMYLDKLSGLLTEQDFDRIYRRIREERAALEQLPQGEGKAGLLPCQASRAGERAGASFP